MEVTQSNTATPQSINRADAAKLSSDFTTFLKMMTAQIKNQDPLDPMDSGAFATQLATFSGVEQQVKTNGLLADLGTQMSALGMGQFASWIGMEARNTAPLEFSGDALTLLPKFDSAATRADLVVQNALGAEVQRIAIDPNDTSIQWRGTDDQGNPFANGLYTFNVESFKGDDPLATHAAESYSKITEARIQNGKTILVLAGGSEIDSAKITALRQAN